MADRSVFVLKILKLLQYVLKIENRRKTCFPKCRDYLRLFTSGVVMDSESW